jgi:signal transduction histidine kinase/pSer/pThr/pTyr-binding forkhead associated (FHA) protein
MIAATAQFAHQRGGAVPRLLVIKGADEGKQFELSAPRVGIGRDAANPIRLHDTEVSRRHAEFRLTQSGAYAVADVGSVNGTFVNNQRIAEEVGLAAGDHVQLGQTTLVYSAGRADSQAADDDLAARISMITRHDLELSSAIIKTVTEGEGSRLLSKPDQANTPWLKTALANLAIMYEASQAISHILDISDLLNKILELIFGSVEADRGCVMLRQPEGTALEPRAVRWRREPDEAERIDVSRTIVEYVLENKQGVLVSDAAQDERFSTGQSILRFGIREVICVPMKGRHETLGVLYLDTRSTARDVVARGSASGKFTEEHLSLVSAVAHQAALAVEETRYHQAMVQAERLAAVGQTIAALSHHIKNILQALRSGSDILKMGLADRNDALVQQGWKMAEKAQGKIYDLVLDMLSYSKEREPAVEPTDLNQLAEEVVELMQGRARELNVRLEFSPDEHLPSVPVDPEGIHRALMNIIGNALDAAEARPNPQVTVGTRFDSEPGWVRLVVLDNGAGIAPQKLADIFKPFVSSKGSKGTGLGLAVSRKILREHGGDILVQSQVGKGSRFVLRLPIKSPLSQDLGASSAEMPLLD